MALRPNTLASSDPQVANYLSENPYDRLNRIWGTPMLRGLVDPTAPPSFLQNAGRFVESLTTPRNVTSMVGGALMPYPQLMSPLHQRINARAGAKFEGYAAELLDQSPETAARLGAVRAPDGSWLKPALSEIRGGIPNEEAARIARLPRLERAEALGWGEKVRGQAQTKIINPEWTTADAAVKDTTKRIGQFMAQYPDKNFDELRQIPEYQRLLQEQKERVARRGQTPVEIASNASVELPNVWFHSTSSEPLKGVGLTRKRLGENTGAPSAKKAYWFASEPEVSESYIGKKTHSSPELSRITARQKTIVEQMNAIYMKNEEAIRAQGGGWSKQKYDEALRRTAEDPLHQKLDAEYQRLGSEYNKVYDQTSTQLPAGTMTKTRLRMQNPYIHDQGGQKYREETYNDLVKKAKEGGHDGLVILNTYDPGGGAGGHKLTNIAAVWNENQVRVPHAKFNPYHVGSGDVLKTVAPIALLGGSAARLTYENKKPKESVSLAPSHRARKD